MAFVFRCSLVLVACVSGVAVSLNRADPDFTGASGHEDQSLREFEEEAIEPILHSPAPHGVAAKDNLFEKQHTFLRLAEDVPDPAIYETNSKDNSKEWSSKMIGTSKILEILAYEGAGDEICGSANPFPVKNEITKKEHTAQPKGVAGMAACWAFTNSVIMASFIPHVFKNLKTFQFYCQRIFAIRSVSTDPMKFYGYPIVQDSIKDKISKQPTGLHELMYPTTGLSSFGPGLTVGGALSQGNLKRVPSCKQGKLRDNCYSATEANSLMDKLFMGHGTFGQHIAGAIGIARPDPTKKEDYHYAPFTISFGPGRKPISQMVVIDGYDDGTGKKEAVRLMPGASYVQEVYNDDGVERLAISYGSTYRAFDSETFDSETFDSKPGKMCYKERYFMNVHANEHMRGKKPTNRLIACTQHGSRWTHFGPSWIDLETITHCNK